MVDFRGPAGTQSAGPLSVINVKNWWNFNELTVSKGSPSLLSGRLWASLVTLWLTAQNRTVPTTPTRCFCLSISLLFICFQPLSSFQPSLGSAFCSFSANGHYTSRTAQIFVSPIARHLYPWTLLLVKWNALLFLSLLLLPISPLHTQRGKWLFLFFKVKHKERCLKKRHPLQKLSHSSLEYLTHHQLSFMHTALLFTLGFR